MVIMLHARLIEVIKYESKSKKTEITGAHYSTLCYTFKLGEHTKYKKYRWYITELHHSP